MRTDDRIPDDCMAVIFSAQRLEDDPASTKAYEETAQRMMQLAATMPGYLGVEHARNRDGFGITISYWESEEAIKNWRDNGEHSEARRRGKQDWYSNYTIRVTRVERAYEWTRQESDE